MKKTDLKQLRSDLWVKSEMIIIRHGRINQRPSKLSGPFSRKKFDIDWKLGLTFFVWKIFRIFVKKLIKFLILQIKNLKFIWS